MKKAIYLVLVLLGIFTASIAGAAAPSKEAALITLADNVVVPAGQDRELGPFDVGDFKYLALLGTTGPEQRLGVDFQFAADPVGISDFSAKGELFFCDITSQRIEQCQFSNLRIEGTSVRIAGPFLAARVRNRIAGDVTFTLRAFLTK